MCEPISTSLALASTAGGTYLNSRAASRAAASNQAAVNRQTDMSREEYDQRRRLSNENYERDFTRSSGEYDKRVRTTDESDARIRDVNREGQQVQTQAELDDIGRSTDVILQAISGRRGVTNQAYDEREAARQLGEALRGAESGRQREFQKNADQTIDRGIADTGYASAEAGRGASRLQRSADIGGTVTAPATVDINVSDAIKQAIASEQAKGAGKARAVADAGATVASYGDLLDSGANRLATLKGDLSGLDTKARISMAPLETELGMADLKYRQAGDRAEDKIGSIADAMDGGLRESAQRKRLVQVPAAYRQASLADSIAQLNDNLVGSSIDYENGSNASSGRYIGSINGSSSNYENAMRGLTDMRIRSTPSTSMLGGLLTQLGSYGFSMAQNPTTNWSKIGSSIARPFQSRTGGSGP